MCLDPGMPILASQRPATTRTKLAAAAEHTDTVHMDKQSPWMMLPALTRQQAGCLAASLPCKPQLPAMAWSQLRDVLQHNAGDLSMLLRLTCQTYDSCCTHASLLRALILIRIAPLVHSSCQRSANLGYPKGQHLRDGR